jgi:fatty acid desaturase
MELRADVARVPASLIAYARALVRHLFPYWNSKHDGAHVDDKLWIVHGKRYDLSRFAHPGGSYALSLGRGRDCTVLFETYHFATSKHFAALDRFASEGVGPVAARRSGLCFWDELRERVAAEIGERKYMSRGRATLTACLTCFGVIPSFAWWWATGSIAAATAWPLLQWLMATNVSHDGSHFGVVSQKSAPRFVNALATLAAWPLFSNTRVWMLQHVASHHQYTNTDNDPDVFHFFRMTDEQDEALRLGALLFFLYVFACPIMVFGYTLQVFVSLALPRLSSAIKPPGVRLSPWEVALMCLELTTAAGLFVAAALRHGLWRAALPWLVASAVFTLVTQVSHLHGAKGDDRSFAHWQVSQSLDYRRENHLVGFLTGGLNNQALHHLFPCVGSEHLPRLVKVFLETCARHGVAPVEASGWRGAASRWLARLWELNAPAFS